MAKAPKWGSHIYRNRTRRKLGRHTKKMNKSEKRSFKPYVGQGR